LAGAAEAFAAVVSSVGAVADGVVESPVLPCLFFLVVLVRALVPVVPAGGLSVAEGFVAGEPFPAAVPVAGVVEDGVFVALGVPAVAEVELFFFLWRDDLWTEVVSPEVSETASPVTDDSVGVVAATRVRPPCAGAGVAPSRAMSARNHAGASHPQITSAIAMRWRYLVAVITPKARSKIVYFSPFGREGQSYKSAGTSWTHLAAHPFNLNAHRGCGTSLWEFAFGDGRLATRPGRRRQAYVVVRNAGAAEISS
jgi:hypothetical protein